MSISKYDCKAHFMIVQQSSLKKQLKINNKPQLFVRVSGKVLDTKGNLSLASNFFTGLKKVGLQLGVLPYHYLLILFELMLLTFEMLRGKICFTKCYYSKLVYERTAASVENLKYPNEHFEIFYEHHRCMMVFFLIF